MAFLNRSQIAKKAWSLFKNHKGDWSFGECMKEAWAQAKLMAKINFSSKKYQSLVKLVKSAPYEAIEDQIIDRFIEVGMSTTNWSALTQIAKGDVMVNDFANELVIKLGQKAGKQYGLCVQPSFFA